MNIFRKLSDYTRLYYAVKKADEAHVRTGERYYVIPGDNGKLIVMNRFEFRKLKQKGYISRKASVNDLIRESFYFTPHKNGSGCITPEYESLKREEYYAYMNSLRKAKATKKK